MSDNAKKKDGDALAVVAPRNLEEEGAVETTTHFGVVALAVSAIYKLALPLKSSDKSGNENNRGQGAPYNPEKAKQAGALFFDDMVYCVKLSIMAYMGKDQDYEKWPGRWKLTWMDLYPRSDPKFLSSEGGLRTTLDREYYLDLVEAFSVNDVQGYVAMTKNFDACGGDLVIAFRGTESFSDWMRNFSGVKTPYEPVSDGSEAGAFSAFQGKWYGNCCFPFYSTREEARVHTGFYLGFLGVKDLIDKHIGHRIRKCASNGWNCRIIVVGHSMGGAIASLCSGFILMKYMDHRIEKLPPTVKLLSITFGQPKVGNAAYNDWLMNLTCVKEKTGGANLYRITTELDPVPCVPPTRLGYIHSYDTALITSLGDLFVGVSLKETIKAQAFTRALRNVFMEGTNATAHHDVFYYAERLRMFSEKRTKEITNALYEDAWNSKDFGSLLRNDPTFLETF